MKLDLTRTGPILVSDNNQTNISLRVQRLQAEAKSLAKEHITALVMAMSEVQHLAYDISLGGDVYPAGVRDIARRLVEDIESKALNIQAIHSRT